MEEVAAGLSIRDTFLSTAEKYSSLKALNQTLHEWVDKKNHTLHRVTERRPVDLLGEEKLRPLPENWHHTGGLSSKYCC